MFKQIDWNPITKKANNKNGIYLTKMQDGTIEIKNNDGEMIKRQQYDYGFVGYRILKTNREMEIAGKGTGIRGWVEMKFAIDLPERK